MKAPQVPSGISGEDAKNQLQFAINHIAEIYTIIGQLPYHVAAKDIYWQSLVEIYNKGERTLDDLATDPIPF